MGWLYEPEKEKNPVYNLPIHSNDGMLGGFDYKLVIDSYNANGGEKTEESLKDLINETVDMKLRDMWECYQLCRENLLKECGIKEE